MNQLTLDLTSYMEKQTASEKRSTRRHVRRVKMTINGQQVVTKDISSGGAAFEVYSLDMPKTFKAVISLKRGQLELICRTLSNGRVKFVDASNYPLLKQVVNGLVD